MSLRKILTYPDPLLHRVAEPIEKFDTKLVSLVSDMVETMRQAPGIGLAAPQIGQPIRLIVVEIPSEKENESSVLYSVCNPIITERSGQARIEEGCLSLPGFFIEVDRSKEVRLEGQNPDGTPFLLEADGLLAICFQHEIDHLEGKMLVNYVGPVKRELYRKEMKKRRETIVADSQERRRTL